MPAEFREHLKTSGSRGLKIREEKARENSTLISVLEFIDERYKKWNAMKFVITSKEYAFADYGSQFGLELSMYNGYSKPIKYVTFTVRPYNRVGDITSDDLGRNRKEVRMIGPLDSKEEASVKCFGMTEIL